MSEINLQLKKLGNNREGLQEYLRTLDIDEVNLNCKKSLTLYVYF